MMWWQRRLGNAYARPRLRYDANARMLGFDYEKSAPIMLTAIVAMPLLRRPEAHHILGVLEATQDKLSALRVARGRASVEPRGPVGRASFRFESYRGPSTPTQQKGRYPANVLEYVQAYELAAALGLCRGTAVQRDVEQQLRWRRVGNGPARRELPVCSRHGEHLQCRVRCARGLRIDPAGHGFAFACEGARGDGRVNVIVGPRFALPARRLLDLMVATLSKTEP